MSSTPPPPVCFFSWNSPLWYWLNKQEHPCMRGKASPLLPNSEYICSVNILLKTGDIPRLIKFYKLFLSEIKINILINSWHFFMILLDVPFAALQLTPSVFRKWKVLDRAHVRQVLAIYRICSPQILNF